MKNITSSSFNCFKDKMAQGILRCTAFDKVSWADHLLIQFFFLILDIDWLVHVGKI